MNEEQQEELKDLEKKVVHGDDAGIRARWESGRHLLGFRGKDGRLPNHIRNSLAKLLGRHHTELTARMKFATKFRDDQLANVISQHRTWFTIKQKALTDAPRPREAKTPALRSIVAALTALEPTKFGSDAGELLDQVDALTQRWRTSIKTLKTVETSATQRVDT